VDFFDAMAANKRNSLLLIVAMSFVFIFAAGLFSYMFNLGYFGLIFGFLVIMGYAFVVFFLGDRMVLAVSGARKLDPREHPFIHNVVEGLAAASQIPVPQVYVMEDSSPNAFATGRDPEHASIAVTTGLLQRLNRQELEGVLAHEISHIANYDIRFMMIAIVFAGAIGFISSLAVRLMWFGAGDRRWGRGRGGGALQLIALVFMIVAPFIALLVRLAISRQREYLADANAGRMTRYPEGLASALEKITRAAIPMQNASDMTAPLFIANPFNKTEFLFSSHPDPQDRIKRLRAMY
jgi:heat shock protein HtpX